MQFSRQSTRAGMPVPLLAGWGGLVVILSLAAADALFAFREIRIESARIRRSFLARHHALDEIRSGIFLSGTFVRDYLLAPSQIIADTQWVELQNLQAQTDAAIRTYSGALAAGELAPLRSVTG